MIVSINQPAYLPWLGYFHRIAISDLHIVLDHVQFEKNSFSNRNKIRIPAGSCWLTVPLKTKGRFGELQLNTVEIAADARWNSKHHATIAQNYAKAPHYREYADALTEWYQHSWQHLRDLTRETTRYQLEKLGIRTPLVFSSALSAAGVKDELVLNLCKQVGASVYLSGPLGRNYLRAELFAAAGVRIAYHDYVHPTYRQAYAGFDPYMAALDLLLNCGPDSLRVLREGNERIEAELSSLSAKSESRCA